MHCVRPAAAGLPLGLCLALATWGCGQRRVELIGAIPDGAAGGEPCPAELASRLSFQAIPVTKDVEGVPARRG